MKTMKQIGVDVDVNRVIEANRQSFAETENDILRRLLLDRKQGGLAKVTVEDAPQFGARQRGNWQVAVGRKIVGGTSLKDAYCKLLMLGHEQDPRFLARMAQEKGRTRRFVAARPEALYPASPHLAKDHALELVPGWFADTNLSETQVSHRARTAARVLGMAYGKEVWLRENGRTI